ncbi:hypothetical protein Clacol_000123 [Clathrus columnatus]|uniref:Sugar phosphate transporter domain-containing protein n=1 Tax=Clathrus columnatus TaxID=1419009 RepID=A0AAV4ZYX8_9AGAM|nr:hypothetical protein Clacol_000123 [Clathrus columnatus]
MSSTNYPDGRGRYHTVNETDIPTEFIESELQTGIHFASIDEKKRLWWKNALITAGCITSWCVIKILMILRRIKIVPTALATAADIGLSNMSLQAITLTFYKTFSLRLVGVILLILVGEILMVATEAEFSLKGFILVISASASAGLRWSLTQLLLKRNKKGEKSIGLDTPPAALFWMTPAMAVALGILSVAVYGVTDIYKSKFFDGFETAIRTSFILQRAGVVPMSIAGIFKEVATMSASALVFGDELTPLNVTGIVIAFSGIVLFTYHKYRKSLESTVSLDAHGNPVEDIDIDEEYTPGTFGLEESRLLNGEEDTLGPSGDPLFSIGPEDESKSDIDESLTLVNSTGRADSPTPKNISIS